MLPTELLGPGGDLHVWSRWVTDVDKPGLQVPPWIPRDARHPGFALVTAPAGRVVPGPQRGREVVQDASSLIARMEIVAAHGNDDLRYSAVRTRRGVLHCRDAEVLPGAKVVQLYIRVQLGEQYRAGVRRFVKGYHRR